jgi:hypothetical protein
VVHVYVTLISPLFHLSFVPLVFVSPLLHSLHPLFSDGSLSMLHKRVRYARIYYLHCTSQLSRAVGGRTSLS